VRELENQIDLATKTALASAQEHFDQQVCGGRGGGGGGGGEEEGGG